jgi:protein SCO1
MSKRPRKKSLAGGGAALAVTGVLALSLTACGGGKAEGGAGKDGTGAASQSGSGHKKGGTVLDQPFDKPDLTLTDSHGKKYDLVEKTKGKPTLLYFGYTHCPDICPLTMSNIAVAKSKLPKKEQRELRVVFVTSDPKRDTPKQLGSWLRSQDPSFVGLTGDFDTIQAGARGVGVSIAPSYKKKNGDVVSTHGAQLLAFSPKDDKGHVVYTEGNTKPEVLKRDLPKLVKGENP